MSIEITLTEFVDFVRKAGTRKSTVVRQAFRRRVDGYDPATDFYKPLREGLVHHHKIEASKANLDRIVSSQTDGKKLTAYPSIIAGYKKFLGRKTITSFGPPRVSWEHGGLTVIINPELGLVINGDRHVIKLYFKSEKLTKFEMDLISYLMSIELAHLTPASAYGILDVRNAKFYASEGGSSDPDLQSLVEGEALSFASIYASIATRH